MLTVAPLSVSRPAASSVTLLEPLIEMSVWALDRDVPVLADLQARLARDVDLHDRVVVLDREGERAAELDDRLARVAVHLDVHGLVVRRAERQVQDRLAVVVRRRAVVVVVEPSHDHRRVDVAVQELDEHQLAHRGDARASDPLRRDGHAREDDARVPQHNRARVVVTVAARRMRVLLLNRRELGRSDAADLFADELLDAVEERERHVSPFASRSRVV